MRLGKDKQASLIAVFLVFAASASGQTGRSYKFPLNGNLQKTDVINEGQSITINYSISEITLKVYQTMRGHFIVSLFPATFLLPTQGNLSFRFFAG